MMMKTKAFVMALIATLGLAACNGQTVIPFTTHEGSGLASCVSDVKQAFPKATVTGAFSIHGHEVRSGKAKVEKWINGLVK